MSINRKEVEEMDVGEFIVGLIVGIVIGILLGVVLSLILGVYYYRKDRELELAKRADPTSLNIPLTTPHKNSTMWD